jgi:hypothetical protein
VDELAELVDLEKDGIPWQPRSASSSDLHSGEPVLTGEGYVGLELHRAARICQAAHGGQVLLSTLSANLAGKELPDGVGLRPLGSHRLKDLSDPTELHQLLVEGLANEFPPPRTLELERTNLPVQPTPLVGREQELDETQALIAREARHPGGTTRPASARRMSSTSRETSSST